VDKTWGHQTPDKESEQRSIDLLLRTCMATVRHVSGSAHRSAVISVVHLVEPASSPVSSRAHDHMPSIGSVSLHVMRRTDTSRSALTDRRDFHYCQGSADLVTRLTRRRIGDSRCRRGGCWHKSHWLSMSARVRSSVRSFVCCFCFRKWTLQEWTHTPTASCPRRRLRRRQPSAYGVGV
jgi:hypothetical protein